MSIAATTRYAFRALRGHPVVTVVAVVTLGLAVGANTALFSLIRPVLLEPLPYPGADELSVLWSTQVEQGQDEMFTALPDFREWQRQSRTIDQLTGFAVTNVNLVGGGDPERLTAALVSAEFLDVLEVEPALGRGFSADEDSFGNHYKVILSHGLWQRRFGGDAAVLGRTVTLGEDPYQVVGVMPAGFRLPSIYTQVWLPLAFPPEDPMTTRGNRFLVVVGRLAEDATLESAGREMSVIARNLARAHPENAGVGVRVLPFSDLIIGDVERPLWMLTGAVAFVLLIACVNIANLLLARGLGRRRETAIRGALGASRGQVLGQMLVESVLIGLMGSVLGAALAYGAIQLLGAHAPDRILRIHGVSVDPGVLLFALGLSVLVSLFFGLLPALQTSRPDYAEVLREGGRTGAGRRGRRSRAALVIGEVALACILLVGAGLFIRSLVRILQVDPGVRTDGVVTMLVSLPPERYPEPHQTQAFFRSALERVEALPGVERTAAGSRIPFIQADWTKNLSIEGRPAPSALEEVPFVQFRQVSPGYFETLGVPLVEGRAFSDSDHGEAPGVAVINETLARRYFQDQDPVGERIWLGPPEPLLAGMVPPDFRFPRLTVVGVAGDIRGYGLNEPALPEVYVPHAQAGAETASFMYLVAETTSDPLAMARAIRHQIQEIDPQQPVAEIETLDALLATSLSDVRFQTLLLSLFALLAVILAAVGIYGVISYDVLQRRHEIGIRTALGAQPQGIVKLVIGGGMRLTLWGLFLGMVGSLLLVGVLQGLVYGVGVRDPLTLVGAALLLALVALVASFLPARRASRLDPNQVLREAQGRQ